MSRLAYHSPMARLLARLALPFLVAVALAGAGCGPKSKDCTGVLCGGACVDPASFQTDPNNCGFCGIRCGAGATCSGGACQCALGTDLCPLLVPRCRNLQTDQGACGSCTTDCTTTKPGSTCQTAACACGGTNPDDCTTFCTNLATDPKNCGTCGNACPLTNEACSGGACACPSTFPTQCPTASPTACVNTTNDPSNCGTCGNVCSLTNEICASSACTCPTAFPTACPTACVNTTNDPSNCGGCGQACPTNATCSGGTCQCHAGQILCANACIACAGGVCSGGSCLCPAGPASGCSGQCCSGGTQCCTSGACPTQHSNGLGGSYYDCNPLYSPAQTTHAAALAAADSWNTGIMTWDGNTVCGSYCVGRQTATQCAVWCYGISPLAGHVGLNNLSNACTVCPTPGSPTWN